MFRTVKCQIPYEIEPGIFWSEPGNLGELTGNLRTGGSAVVGVLGDALKGDPTAHETYAANG